MLKLQSSDGVIFSVDQATVEKMVTIQTMIDHEDEDSDSDEVIPVPTVKAEVLEKIIQWTGSSEQERETENWSQQYFNFELEKMFEIIIAADYLEVKSLLNETCRRVIINHTSEAIEDVVKTFGDKKVSAILEDYKRENNYEIIIRLLDSQNKKCLKMFDTKVSIFRYFVELIIIENCFCFRLNLGCWSQRFLMTFINVDVNYAVSGEKST